MKLFRLLFVGLILSASLFSSVNARDASEITDWYVKDFQSKIILNKDSSLDITESIIADCGNLPNKHGIFRIVPTFYQKSATEKVKTPIDSVSITDFSGNPLKFTTTKNSDSITWKIGDPNKTVSGLNYYKISYKVHNAIRFDNGNFDELYWNLNGNFWEMEIDNFVAKVILPNEINETNSQISLYTGSYGVKDNGLATFTQSGNEIIAASTRTLEGGEGITLSITFPKNIVTKEPISTLEIMNYVLIALFPIITLALCIIFWRRYGRDPKLKKTEMVQYEPPKNLGPMEASAIISNGYFKTNSLSAAIVKFAVQKMIIIEEIPKKGVFDKKDFRLKVIDSSKDVSQSERELFDKLFEGKSEILLSSLKNNFYKDIPAVAGKVRTFLIEKRYFEKSGFSYQIGFIVITILFIGLGIALLAAAQYAGLGLILSAVIVLIFSFLMRRRTPQGAEILWQIQGFKLFMTKAEKYRQQFHEKEGVFDKYLPYAMIFGITTTWINNMKKIYGEEYFNTYHPYWYTGYALAHFDANSFEKSLNGIASSMTTTMVSNPSSSGAGGGGFSGGGGGGGGGGGW